MSAEEAMAAIEQALAGRDIAGAAALLAGLDPVLAAGDPRRHRLAALVAGAALRFPEALAHWDAYLAATAAPAERDLLARGRSLAYLGRIAEALQQFLSVPRTEKGSLNGVVYAARLHADLGNLTACLAVFEDALQAGCSLAQEAQLRLKRADFALQAGRTALALSDQLFFSQVFPQKPQGLVGQIRTHLAEFDRSAAGLVLSRAQARFPQDPGLRAAQARFLWQYGSDAEIFAYVDRLVAEQTPAAELGRLLHDCFGDRRYYFSQALQGRLQPLLVAGGLPAATIRSLLPSGHRQTVDERVQALRSACARHAATPDSPVSLKYRVQLAAALVEADLPDEAAELVAGLERTVQGWPYVPPLIGEMREWREARAGRLAQARQSYWARRRMIAARDRSDELECLRLLPDPAPPVVVFCQLRNEMAVLPAFFRHYRGLGVQRFVMIDNASTDGSLDWLQAQPDVELYRTAAPFRRAEAGNAWVNPLIARPAYAGTLCLRVDADEHLIYPHVEERPIAMLWEHMQAEGADVLAGHMLDMLPRTMAELEAEGADPVATARFYEPPDEVTPTFCTPYFNVMGGVRSKLITTRATHLTKCSGLRGGGTVEQQRASHRASPAVVSAVGMILLHYKFRPDFFERARRVASEHHYASSSQEFTLYAGLEAERDRVLLSAASREYRGSAAMVAEGLLRSSAAWDGFGG